MGCSAHLSGEGNEVVFAETGEFYFADNHHLFMVFGKDCVVDHI